MKTHLFCLTALALLFLSCQTEKQDIPDGKADAPEIVAGVETQSDTKTILSTNGAGVGTIYWAPADQINVFYGTTSTLYTSRNTENATTAVFRTNDIIGSMESESSNIWGLYPYDEDATCTGTAVVTSLPASQNAVAGSFDDDLFPMLAHSATHELQFYNVCGGIKFSLSRDDIISISFRGNNDEYLAGDFSVTFENGLPKATVVNGVKEITLTPKGRFNFAPGVNYYIIALPCTLSEGFTMTFTTYGGTVGTFTYNDRVEIKRSIFGRKANINTYATFPTPNVLFLGNSITLHPVASDAQHGMFWWGLWGMAATRRENDYVHRVMAGMKEKDGIDRTFAALNASAWELNYGVNLSSVISESNLRTDTELIVVRIGENVPAGNLKTVEGETVIPVMENALVDFINHLISRAPSAQIIVTNQFWPNADKDAACYNAAVRTGVTFVNVNFGQYAACREVFGHLVWGDDGEQHAINHDGVASHPSDVGMQAIADAILGAIYPPPPDDPEGNPEE